MFYALSLTIKEYSSHGKSNCTYLIDGNYKQDIDGNRHNIDDY